MTDVRIFYRHQGIYVHYGAIFNIVRPYLIPSIALMSTVLLIVVTYFVTGITLLWVALLWTILIVAIFLMIGQTTHADRRIKNYASQLITSKERVTNEIKHRLWAEKTTAESKIRLQFIDENIPVMLAYFNIEQRCRYHNQIFRRWFGLRSDQIDGQLLPECSSEAFYSGIKNCIEAVMTGKTIQNERILKSIKGVSYIFTEQFIPHLDGTGKVIGFYMLHTPRVQEKNHTSLQNDPEHNILKPADSGKNEALIKNSKSQTSKAGITAARIVQAIEGGEFQLYCQQIISLKQDTDSSTYHEILIRMAEEENNLMPPGAFLPFVEQHRMMPRLDRWVVDYIIQWLSAHRTTSESIFCINVAKDTLNDPHFPDFIREQLQKFKIPAQTLCFEIDELDAGSDLKSTQSFTHKARQLGCLVSLCSFNHSRASLGLLRKIKIDFLKIDGSLVCNILRDQGDLKKIIAINHIARAIKIQTIAELVETDEIIIKLREIGVDFAQGFGMARPRPLKDLE